MSVLSVYQFLTPHQENYYNYYSFVLTKGTKTLPPETFPCLKISPKCVCCRSSTLGSAGGTYIAPHTPYLD